MPMQAPVSEPRHHRVEENSIEQLVEIRCISNSETDEGNSPYRHFDDAVRFSSSVECESGPGLPPQWRNCGPRVGKTIQRPTTVRAIPNFISPSCFSFACSSLRLKVKHSREHLEPKLLRLKGSPEGFPQGDTGVAITGLTPITPTCCARRVFAVKG